MKGYKVFVRRRPSRGSTGLLGWHGPYYRSPSEWRIRAGALLTANIDLPQYSCGAGVNFWPTKAMARTNVRYLGSLFSKKNICVYAVETAPGAVVLRGHDNNGELWDKARTTKLRLLKRITL